MDASLRILLPIYLVVYFAVAFFWRSYRVWKRTGVNPYVLGKTDNAHDFIGKIFRLTSGLSVVVVILYAASIRLYQYLTPIIWLQQPALRWCESANSAGAARAFSLVAQSDFSGHACQSARIFSGFAECGNSARLCFG